MGKAARKMLTMALLAVFLFSTATLAAQYFDKQNEAAAHTLAEDLAGLAAPETAPPETDPEPETAEATENTEPPKKIWVSAPVEDGDPWMEELAKTDLDALRQVNEEVVGWITIPDTTINFPITQAQDNTFYLEHSWDGTPNQYGAIFLECMNDADFTDYNTIVYGHNMRDGSMFHELYDYSREDFWRAHPYVYIVTDSGVFRYEVFAGYFAKVDSKTYGLSFNQAQTRRDFLQMARENSNYDTGITPALADRILTLSTCTGWGYSSRWVVHARLKMMQVFETPAG